MSRVRVVTYNILMGGRRGQALHEVVRAMGTDVLLVNESPKWPLIWRLRSHRLADAWGMRFVTGGRPAGSNMIVVAPGVQVERAGSETLRQPLFQPRRGVAWAQLRVGGALMGAVSCHLSLTRERRLREVERVISVAGKLRGPVIVGGDLNEPPNGPSWRRLREAGFLDHGGDNWPTYPAERPRKRIDGLLVKGAVDTLRHGDPGVDHDLLVRASDHRPVLVVLDTA